jgi:ABC-type sulfate transport system permease subunit
MLFEKDITCAIYAFVHGHSIVSCFYLLTGLTFWISPVMGMAPLLLVYKPSLVSCNRCYNHHMQKVVTLPCPVVGLVLLTIKKVAQEVGIQSLTTDSK